MNITSRLSLYLILPITIGFTACSKQDDTSSIGRQAPLNNAAVIATVNGFDITEPELKFLLQLRESSGQPISRESGIDELIGIELLRQQAIADGLHKDEMLAAEMNRQSMQVLATNVIRQFVKSQVINDQDIFAEYNNYTSTLSNKEYKVRHILSKTEREALNNIDDLNSGVNFEDLAKKRSTDSSSESGGEIGWITPNNVVKPFADAMTALTAGQYTQKPVETRYGWHIILLEETRPTDPPSLDSIKNQLKNTILNRRIKDHINELRNKANVQLTEAGENTASAEPAPKPNAESQTQ